MAFRASRQGGLATVRQLLTFMPSVVEYLLSQGADPNRQTNESGDPVLLGIAYFEHLECRAEAGAPRGRRQLETARARRIVFPSGPREGGSRAALPG